jgi:hypothetical protein
MPRESRCGIVGSSKKITCTRRFAPSCCLEFAIANR